MWWIRARVHSSWVIALVSAGFVAGVAGALFIRVPFAYGVFSLGVLCVGFIIRRRYVLPFACAAAGVFGASYGTAHLVERDVYASIIGIHAQVEGKIKEDPGKSASGKYSVQIDSIRIDGVAYPGVIFSSVGIIGEAKRGDIVKLSGPLKEGFGSFPVSVSALRFESVVRPFPGDIGRVVRDWFASEVRELIPEPQASLGIGFLTGQKSALPTDLADALKIAGLTHIVVASGYNLTILVRMARKLFLRVSKYLSAVFSGVMIVSFMAVTGLSPSMTRAGLVSSLSLLAWYYGHGFHPFVLLPFAAAITVALQPSYAWGDLGWQLSFSAFAGVMLVAPLVQQYFFGKKEPGILRQILGETVAAHAVTVPVIALSFGVVSNVAIIANLLVVPLVPLAMLLTFICGLCAIFSVPFAWLVAEPTNWLLSYMVGVARYVSELEWAQSETSAEQLVWAGYTVALFVACYWMWKQTQYNFRGSEPLM